MIPPLDLQDATLLPAEPLHPMTTEAEVIRSAGRHFAQFPVQTPCGRPALRAFTLTEEDVRHHHLREGQDIVIEILHPQDQCCRVLKRAPLLPASAWLRQSTTA